MEMGEVEELLFDHVSEGYFSTFTLNIPSMKNGRLLLAVLPLLFLTACFDTIEEFTIHEDGSGEYSMKMDMYKMIEMMSQFAGEKDLSNSKDFNEVKDSSFNFIDVIAEANTLSAEEKDIFKEGSFRMHMSLKDKETWLRYSFPYKNRGDLAKIYANGPKALEAAGKQMKPETTGNDATHDGVMPNTGAANDVFKSGEFFELTNEKGLFEKKARVEALKAYTAKDSTLQQMLPMLGEAYSITIIHLPRPVKKIDHPNAQLSADKKTVTLKFPFTDLVERPEAMNFKIEY